MPNINNKEIALEERDIEGARLFSPSAARNRDVVRDVLVQHLPQTGAILEVGAGTGEHAVHFAAAVPDATWLPGDPDLASRASIAAWIAHTGLQNVKPPHTIDVCEGDWRLGDALPLAGIVSLNMIHISPFEATRGLIAGAGRYLMPKGILFLYGPFSRNGNHTAPSNAEFDQSLKSRDPSWGVRDLENDIAPLAIASGLELTHVISMPANNACVVFEKSG